MLTSKHLALVLTIASAGCGGAHASSAPTARPPKAQGQTDPAEPPSKTGANSDADLRVRMNLPNACDRGDARECERRCARGEADGCGMLGIVIMSREGKDRDVARGVSLFQSACDGGDGASCLALAFMMDAGKDVPHDEARSAELLRKGVALLERACAGGDPKVGECFVLARMFEEGKVVPADRAHAGVIFTEACDGGDVAMCDQLGMRYADGRWGKDFAHAALLFKKGCEATYAPSCMNLGILTRDGLGTPENKDAARRLFEQACNGEVREACVLLDPKEESRIEAQKNEVRQLVKACEGGEQQACKTLRAAKMER